MNRSDIRKSMRAQRRSVSDVQRDISALALLNNLATQSWYLESDSVAAYLSNDGEIDLAPVIEDLIARKKKMSLPKVNSDQGLMHFCDWQPSEELVSNRYGILEPTKEAMRPLVAHSLVLTPLVAFDSVGNRIGMGGGYYDRLLSKKSASEESTYEERPLIVGVGYEFQQLGVIEAEEWDIPLDAVVTDKEVIPISARLARN